MRVTAGVTAGAAGATAGAAGATAGTTAGTTAGATAGESGHGDASFDRYARMVQRVLRVPVATVTMVESDPSGLQRPRRRASGAVGHQSGRPRCRTPICQYVVRDRAVSRDPRRPRGGAPPSTTSRSPTSASWRTPAGRSSTRAVPFVGSLSAVDQRAARLDRRGATRPSRTLPPRARPSWRSASCPTAAYFFFFKKKFFRACCSSSARAWPIANDPVRGRRRAREGPPSNSSAACARASGSAPGPGARLTLRTCPPRLGRRTDDRSRPSPSSTPGGPTWVEAASHLQRSTAWRRTAPSAMPRFAANRSTTAAQGPSKTGTAPPVHQRDGRPHRRVAGLRAPRWTPSARTACWCCSGRRIGDIPVERADHPERHWASYTSQAIQRGLLNQQRLQGPRHAPERPDGRGPRSPTPWSWPRLVTFPAARQSPDRR